MTVIGADHPVAVRSANLSADFVPSRSTQLRTTRSPSVVICGTELLALPRREPDLDERGCREPLDRLVPADGVLPFRIARMRFFLNERLLIPHEPVAPDAGRRDGVAVHDRAVDALDRVALELLAQ